MKLKGIIQTGRTSRFEIFQSQPALQPTVEIRVNGAVTHGAGEGGRGAQTESSALVDGSPPLSLCFQFSSASSTLGAHALCAGWTGRLSEMLGTPCTISSGGVGEERATVHPCLVTARRFHEALYKGP